MISTCTFMCSTGQHFTVAKCCVLSYVGLLFRVKPPPLAYCPLLFCKLAYCSPPYFDHAYCVLLNKPINRSGRFHLLKDDTNYILWHVQAQ